MLDDCLRETLFAVLEHLNHKFEFFIQLGDRVVLFLLQLLFDLLDVVFKHFRLLDAVLDLVLEGDFLAYERVHLVGLFLDLVTDLMALAAGDDAFRADVGLARLTQILRLLLRVLQAELFGEVLLWFLYAHPDLLGLVLAVAVVRTMDRRANASDGVSIFLVVDVV